MTIVRMKTSDELYLVTHKVSVLDVPETWELRNAATYHAYRVSHMFYTESRQIDIVESEGHPTLSTA